MNRSWLTEAFTALPSSNDALSRKLSKRLTFNDQSIDWIDQYSRHLACAALTQSRSLLISFPDCQPRRPACLFATLLIRYWYDSTRSQPTATHGQQPILYFGSTIGIREHLKQVSLGEQGLNLAEVFKQQPVGKRPQISEHSSSSSSTFPNSTLPEVLTLYAPTDPMAILELYRPPWIAVDCGDTEHLNWFATLLQTAQRQQMVVLAWGYNPLSECVTEFSRYGQVFLWPTFISSAKTPTLRNLGSEEMLKSIWQTPPTTRIQPLILAGHSVEPLVSRLKEAKSLLVNSLSSSSGRLARDSLKIHWQWLHSLESLPVPPDFYEAEATHHWGLKTFAQLSTECIHFQQACYSSYPQLASKFEFVRTLLEAAYECLKTAGAPLWNSLSNDGLEELPAGAARLIIFTSRARKRLFLLALLAKYNLTEEDLRTLHIWVVYLGELRTLCRFTHFPEMAKVSNLPLLDSTLRWHFLLVASPSPLLAPKLLPLFRQANLDILIYPYQLNTLAYQVDQWNQKLGGDLPGAARVLSHLSGQPLPDTLPSLNPRLELTEELVKLESSTKQKTKIKYVKPLWEHTNVVNEVATLLEVTQDSQEEEERAIETVLPSTKEVSRVPDSWCHQSIEIQFEPAWSACFAPDDTINVVVIDSTGHHFDRRYVQSLRPGDRVVAIPSQRQQDLYELIISRVHHHPAMELHLALIRRWQHDFVTAYQHWQVPGVRNLETLIGQLQQHGSHLSSTLTLRQWLQGHILCPEDKEDLQRLATILDLSFVHTYSAKIYQAAQRLRGLHRGLSRRLNSWLEREACGLLDKNVDELIDSELNLTFGDFRNSILILRVESVQQRTGLFLRDSLGKFERH